MRTPAISMYSLIASLMFLGACQRAEEVAPGQDPGASLRNSSQKKFYGPAQPLGNGVVRAWTKFAGNEPVEIGIDMSGHVMTSLPHEHVMMSLKFHPVKNSGTYTHALVDWAPHGHEPEMYEVPHFDFHFYSQPESERLAIGPGNVAQFANYPAPQYLPEMHIPVGGVPQMGVHWVNLLSPELSGEPFTSTFIYGSYDGSVTFYEPMITLEWLVAQTSTIIEIPQPQAVQHDGYYPTHYKVTRSSNPEVHSVSMDLVHHLGSL